VRCFYASAGAGEMSCRNQTTESRLSPSAATSELFDACARLTRGIGKKRDRVLKGALQHTLQPLSADSSFRRVPVAVPGSRSPDRWVPVRPPLPLGIPEDEEPKAEGTGHQHEHAAKVTPACWPIRPSVCIRGRRLHRSCPITHLHRTVWPPRQDRHLGTVAPAVLGHLLIPRPVGSPPIHRARHPTRPARRPELRAAAGTSHSHVELARHGRRSFDNSGY
jgi:hypothetical protein